jgi:hypothetical protein
VLGDIPGSRIVAVGQGAWFVGSNPPRIFMPAIRWRCLLIHLLSPLRRRVALHSECKGNAETA